MPEEKATINEGSADLSGPDEATKDKISESILARARKEALRLKEETQGKFTKPDESLRNYLKESRSDGEAGRKDFYDKKRGLGNSVEGSDGDDSPGDIPDKDSNNKDVPDKFGEGRKQHIQSSEMERRRKKIQDNKEKSFIKKRPQSLVRQMASFQASKNMILREGVGEIREDNNRNKDNNSDKEDNNKDKDGNSDKNNLSDSSDEKKEADLKAIKQDDKKKQESKVKVEQKGDSSTTKIKLATDNLLKSMIEIILETFTLSAFYVYIHVLLRQIFPNYFSKLGHEWVPDNIKRVSPKKAEEIGDKIGIAEKPAVGCCCLFHLVVIIIICAIIYFMVNWREVIWEWFKGFFS